MLGFQKVFIRNYNVTSIKAIILLFSLNTKVPDHRSAGCLTSAHLNLVLSCGILVSWIRAPHPLTHTVQVCDKAEGRGLTWTGSHQRTGRFHSIAFFKRLFLHHPNFLWPDYMPSHVSLVITDNLMFPSHQINFYVTHTHTQNRLLWLTRTAIKLALVWKHNFFTCYHPNFLMV